MIHVQTLQEGRRLEFKVAVPANADLAKTVVAFANDAGGDIYIGIQDNPRAVVGLNEDELMQLEEKISNAIYDDMIEITSPGLLLPSIDFTQLESRQSDARNKIIAPAFKRLGIIDQWGNGLKLVAEEMQQYKNIELKWQEVGLSFQVQFVKVGYAESVHNPRNGGINGGIKDEALQIIRNNENINTKGIANLLPTVSQRTLERVLKDLKDSNIIEYIGSLKTGGYRVK